MSWVFCQIALKFIFWKEPMLLIENEMSTKPKPRGIKHDPCIRSGDKIIWASSMAADLNRVVW